MKAIIALLLLCLFAISTSAKNCRVNKPPCHATGCYGEVCTDQNPIYHCPLILPGQSPNVCYAAATCKRQKNGQCGWAITSALQACLVNNPVP